MKPIPPDAYDSPPPSGARISRQWITTASLVTIAVCIAGAALMFMRDLLTPLLIAIFLYFLIQPVIEYLFKLKLPQWLLYAVVIALPLLIAVGLVWIVDFNVRAFAERLPTYQSSLFKTLDRIGPYLGMRPGPAVEEPEELPNGEIITPSPPGEYDWETYIGDYIERSRDQLLETAVDITLHIVEVTVLVVFYLLFIFLEARKLRGRIQAGFESATAERIIDVFDKIDDSIRRYLWVKTGVSMGMGISTTVLGWLFGLEFALLWGVFMFIANYVTYVGSIAALAPPIALALVQLSPVPAIILVTLLVLNRLFWIDYAEIKYSGEHLDVSPLLLLISIALLGWIWGVVGMLLAVPLVTSTKIVLSHFDNTRHIAKLMSDD